MPSLIAGLNLYLRTASMAFSSRPIPSATHDVHILRVSLRIHNQANQANTLVLGPSRLVGELRLRLEERNRRRNPAADLRKAAARIPSRPGP